MRHRNLLSFVDPKTRKTRYGKLIPALLRYGWRWYREDRAQEKLARALSRYLGGQFTLLRNVMVPDLGRPWPPLLVGPAGVYLLYVSPKKGIFRVQEETWEEMHPRTRKFRATRPNLVRQVVGMARVMSDHLSDQVGAPIEVRPVIMFIDPGAMVNAIRPMVRIVLADAIENWATQLERQRQELDPEVAEQVVDLLAPRARPGRKERPRKPLPVKQVERQMQHQVRRYTRTLDRYFNFTLKQWVILGVLAFLALLMMVAFILWAVMLGTP